MAADVNALNMHATHTHTYLSPCVCVCVYVFGQRVECALCHNSSREATQRWAAEWVVQVVEWVEVLLLLLLLLLLHAATSTRRLIIALFCVPKNMSAISISFWFLCICCLAAVGNCPPSCTAFFQV